jgi:hypothetical protein
VGTSGGGESGGRARPRLYVDCPSALALVPGLGLVVRGFFDGARLFADPDAIAMSFMSAIRTAWMAAVARRLVSARSRLALRPRWRVTQVLREGPLCFGTATIECRCHRRRCVFQLALVA